MLLSKDISLTNDLINLFTSSDKADFLTQCELVNLESGQCIGNQNDYIQQVFFPVESIISWLKIIETDASMVMALIGNEGMLCISPLLGIPVAPCKAVVHKSGLALRIEALKLMNLIKSRPEMARILKRYIFVSFNQVMQMAACVHFHCIEERLARLLLMLKDRSQSSSFHITHESIAVLLGVRRVGVTKAAMLLHSKNLISYSRGDLVIHNIKGLECVSCICYKSDKETYDQHLNVENLKVYALQE